MKRSRTSLALKCLTAVVAVALLAAPTVQAASANGRPSVATAQHVEPNQAQPNGSGKSYFWSDVAIAGGVLAGILALGLWGDVAIGGAILGFQLLGAAAAIAARSVGANARGASRRVWQVGSSPARPRSDPAPEQRAARG
jgi:predicted lipid-binding transport protein (Tim44 family)